MALLDLSTELLLIIATHLRQVDLLNVALVCKGLQSALEPEIYREYRNTRLYSRSLLPFLRRLMRRPELAKYVHRLDLHPWDTLDIFQPGLNDERDLQDFEDIRSHALGFEDYDLFTQAAVAAGVISTIDSYEPTSRLIEVAESLSPVNDDINEFYPWYEHFFDPEVPFSEIPYDRKFCQLLRAGIEDAQAVLLLALVPNIQTILLRGGPHDINNLEWRSHHHFASLRELVVCGTDGDWTWPIAFFNPVFATATKLESMQAWVGSSWYRDLDEFDPSVDNVLPLSLQPASLSWLRALDLKQCCMTTDDLSSLLRATTGLRHLYYYGGSAQQGPHNPSPAKMIELLEPLKDSLEGLSLELYPDGNEQSHLGGISRLHSLTHFTALRILDTTAEMWSYVSDEELDLIGYDTEAHGALPLEASRLCNRLPKSLRTLIFHLSEEEVQPALSQISDLIKARTKALPNLQDLHVGTDDSFYIDSFEVMLVGVDLDSGPHPLNATVGGGRLATLFDTIIPSRYMPDTKWFGDKYSTRFRKPNKRDLLLDRIANAYRDGTSDVVIRSSLEDEPDFEEYLCTTGFKETLPVEYYDSDEGPGFG